MRIVVGTLKGYDQLMNLVLDDVKETLRGEPQICDMRVHDGYAYKERTNLLPTR